MKVKVGDTVIWKSMATTQPPPKERSEIVAVVTRTWVVKDRWAAEVLMSNGRVANVLQSQLTLVSSGYSSEEAMWMMWGDQ